MKKQISSVANMLDIPASKLRYWDKKGLIRFERDLENNYRVFSNQTIMDICDIIFYRDLYMPIKDIQELYSKEYFDLNELFQENKKSLLNQISKLEKSVEKIDKRIEALNTIEKLKSEGFKIEKYKLKEINHFDFENQSHVESYLENPEETIIFVSPKEGDKFKYGIFSEYGKTIREKDSGLNLYLVGLFWVSTEDKISNLQEFIDKAKELNYIPGSLVGEYLITTGKDIKTDYYIGRMELK
ncbi:MerR family transcriptional regulator [Anaerosphaera multitolerans]|uniref:MerR family transcriptional regulator n=1 Tax=Anaerosphaera multitolerans TaxID=2487351 RepID=A0A437S5A9_9FIRM|nr:MerR family transcriptional regulator [Anaerosphaera multitolerans]RVU54201.1 MerR family transcriptional regulator [Anaerosphaera multitolerans]